MKYPCRIIASAVIATYMHAQDINVHTVKIINEKDQRECSITYSEKSREVIKIDISGKDANGRQSIFNKHDKLPVAPNKIDEVEYFDNVSELVVVEDVNFDGNNDLLIQAYWGVTGNKLYAIFLYDPKEKCFNRCYDIDYICNPKLNVTEKKIETWTNNGGPLRSSETYIWKNSKLSKTCKWELVVKDDVMYEVFTDYTKPPPATTSKIFNGR